MKASYIAVTWKREWPGAGGVEGGGGWRGGPYTHQGAVVCKARNSFVPV